MSDDVEVIRTHGLTKQFGQITAVDAVDLDVRAGDVYGFLGANGSGKTTTVRMLLGLVLATAGSIELLGAPMPASGRDVLPQVGALVEGPAAYPHLSGRTNLALFDATGPGGDRRSRKGRISDALERVGLAQVDGRAVRAYSLGMRQRLGLAAALLRSPRLLVLDEPTNGLDPQGINEIRTLLLDLNREGTTVFLSSHLLSEIEQMCTRVGVLDGGRLVLQDELVALRGPTGRIEVGTPDADRARQLLDGTVEEHGSGRLLVRATDPAELNARLVSEGVRVTFLAPEHRSLEDVVLAATTSGTDRFGRDGGTP
ncbi:MAG: ABC transporter ATP-binding protein [Nocardioides sp.]|nr:ABC transporter ATP-binding protein [Nocardioides sp.]